MVDSQFGDLLVKIFCNIVDTGLLNTSWAISETRKLQDLEGTIELKNQKKVRFLDDNEKLKERVSKLEKEVTEVKRQIREVLSENLMKNTSGRKNISRRN